MSAAAMDAAPPSGGLAGIDPLFTTDWLTLREPLDRAARPVALVQRLAEQMPRGRGVSVVDMGCGTGSNLRALAPHLPVPQTWRCIDRDPLLLRELPNRIRPWAEADGLAMRWEDGDETILAVEGSDHYRYRIELELRDLSAGADDLPLDGVDLVTCAALMDLVSAGWLTRMARAVVEAGAPFYAALTYNGMVDFTPVDPLDEEVIALVNLHQRGDKGFGAALGPDAPQIMADAFHALGWQVATEPSDWDAGPETVHFQRLLIDDYARAAAEIAPADRHDAIAAWRDRRRKAVDRGHGRLQVGHVDLLAHP